MKDVDFQPETSRAVLLGFAALPRELTDLSIWKKTPADAAHALCDLYLLANTEAGVHRLERGVAVHYEPGWCLWSNKALAARWGWRREAVERFMVELEKSEIIWRREISQYGKVIVLRDFATDLYTERAAICTPNGQPFGQPSVQPTGSEAYTEGVGEGDGVGEGVGIGDGEREGDAHAGGGFPEVAIPGLAECLVWAETVGVDREWLRLKWENTTGAHGWERNGRLIDWRRLWRVWFEQDVRLKRWKGSAVGGGEKNGAAVSGVSPAQRRFELGRELAEVQGQMEAFRETDPETYDRLKKRRKEIEAEMNAKLGDLSANDTKRLHS